MEREILKEEAYDEKADVYWFGVSLFLMLSRGGMPKINVVQMGCWKKAEIPSSFSPLAKDLINACWSYDPKDGPSFNKILEKNNFRLFELNDGEVFKVEQFVKQHKGKIPDYLVSRSSGQQQNQQFQ